MKNKEPILVVMAAGMGSRYGGNKQLDPITEQGDIIMDFSLYDAYEAGFRKVCFVIKHDFEEVFKKHIESGAGKKYEVYYAFQDINDLPDGFDVPIGRSKPWGTGHAVLSAEKYVDAPFAVINADDYYGKEGFIKIYEFLKNTADESHNCMVGFNISNTLSEHGTVSRGICEEKNGFLIGVNEHLKIQREVLSSDNEFKQKNNRIIVDTLDDGTKIEIPENSYVSMNLWGFGYEYMEVLKKDFREELVNIIKNNPLKGEFYIQMPINEQISNHSATYQILPTNDKWFGVTYIEDKPNVEEKFKELKESGAYPVNLWQ